MNYGNGYKGNISVNAYVAISNNIKPLFNWKKGEIIEMVGKLNKEIDIKLLEKINISLLRSIFLAYDGFHHVGKTYITKEFFSFNTEVAKNITNSELREYIIKEEKIGFMIDKEKNSEYYKNKLKNKIFKEDIRCYLKKTEYATINGLAYAVKEGRVDIDELKGE